MCVAHVKHAVNASALLGVAAAAASLAIDAPKLPGRDDQVDQILNQRLGVLEEIAQMQRQAYEQGESKYEAVLAADQDLLLARLELARTADDRVKIRDAFVQTARDLERLTSQVFNAGGATRADLLRAQALRLRAEADLLNERAGDTPAAGPESPRTEDVAALAHARLDVVQKFHERREQWQKQAVSGASSPGETYRWSRRWLDAERDVSGEKEAQIRALQSHVVRMKQLEDRFKTATRSGTVPQATMLEIEYYRLEAEFWLAQANAK